MKLGQDSIVQREIGDEIRSSTFAVSETLNQVANVDDRISSPISRWTMESWPSLARLAQKIAVNMTTTAAHRPNVQAHITVTTGAMASTLNMIR